MRVLISRRGERCIRTLHSPFDTRLRMLRCKSLRVRSWITVDGEEQRRAASRGSGRFSGNGSISRSGARSDGGVILGGMSPVEIEHRHVLRLDANRIRIIDHQQCLYVPGNDK